MMTWITRTIAATMLLPSWGGVVAQPLHEVRLEPGTLQTLDLDVAREVLSVRDGRATPLVLPHDPSSGEVRLRAGEQMKIFLRGNTLEAARFTLPATASGDTLCALPERYAVRLKGRENGEGGGAASSAAAALVPVFRTKKQMRFDPGTDRFRGDLLFILQDPGDPASRELETPIEYLFTSSADVAPESIRIQRTNLSGGQTVTVTDPNPRGAVELTVLTDSRPEGYLCSLAVEPQIVIETQPRQLQGWGLQSIPFTVALRGTASPTPDPVPVTVEPSQGVIEGPPLFVGSSGPASTQLRSAGLGPDTVRVITAGYGFDEAYFVYGFPWSFLTASLLGGFAGAGVAFFRRRSAGETPQVLNAMAGGVLWGLIAAAAYLVGLNVSPVDLPANTGFNEVLVFVVAALTAAMWRGAARSTT